MKKADELKKKLVYKRKNFWVDTTKNEQKAAFKFAENYKKFLSQCKTEREVVDFIEAELREKSFVNIRSLKKNDKNKRVFSIINNKVIAVAIIGKRPITEGINIVASHIDAPRVDLKQYPLYEDKGTQMGMLHTHYYGGIKKYQWMSTPLAIHGVVIKNNGELIKVNIGENENDPIFVMPDLLPHLARKEQYTKTLPEAITASQMNVLFNSIPFTEEKEEIADAVKLNALAALNEKYGILEEDLLSAELQLVPANKARDGGIDKSFVIAYGQDDRVCAYTSLQAMYDLKELDIDKTSLIILYDKEEIGSEGNTGANSIILPDVVCDLLKYNNEAHDSYTLRKTIINSQVISADVCAGINPNFPGVHEAQNAVHVGFGIGICKFTGSGGKSGSNDAHAEFMAKLLRTFNEDKVNWQIGELGKVDEGGGGTIAKFLAQYGCSVIDAGPALLSMHSLYEVCSKADLYSTYKAYKSFLLKA